jgi:hypothetical protein
LRREHRERARRDGRGWLLAHAVALISEAAQALTDGDVWTKKSRAARRDSSRGGDKSCSPHDSRARKWTAVGMIELGAVGLEEELLALELLRRAGRGWPIMRVEDARGRTAVIWTMALAVSAPGQRLAPRAVEAMVERRSGRPDREEAVPDTVRSSGRQAA